MAFREGAALDRELGASHDLAGDDLRIVVVEDLGGADAGDHHDGCNRADHVADDRAARGAQWASPTLVARGIAAFGFHWIAPIKM